MIWPMELCASRWTRKFSQSFFPFMCNTRSGKYIYIAQIGCREAAHT